ncbi:VCBS repeat-containing protein [uncultured Sulfitobacter sp.]|uniref:FG-GAP repeat domain-containing protein n=1 Tax=uncultured Sulfitobacter sp. TaxID=191468 RepID=UPI00261853EA|nr:VCBS repeat-containing protein [uncultured Sulfitobacter sp.]
MCYGARRLSKSPLQARARRALRPVCVVLAGCAPFAAAAQNAQEPALVSAAYAEPTERYPHGILGDAISYGALVLQLEDTAAPIVLRLPRERVFEDTAPRLVDIDGNGRREVVVVESHQTQGARLAIYDAGGLVGATPYIGQRFRWLAPVAIADLDGDGLTELAYVDRPHLAKILRVWRFSNGQLYEIAQLPGVTNHRIGETDIGGGLRDCGAGPEMIVASADWRRVMGVRFEGSALAMSDIGPYRDRSSFAHALGCRR